MFVILPLDEGELHSTCLLVYLVFRFRKTLSFHAVSFGNIGHSYTLQRMAQLALEIQNNAPRDPLLPAESTIPSSFTTALCTVSYLQTGGSPHSIADFS
jgi:hypothetical protein